MLLLVGGPGIQTTTSRPQHRVFGPSTTNATLGPLRCPPATDGPWLGIPCAGPVVGCWRAAGRARGMGVNLYPPTPDIATTVFFPLGQNEDFESPNRSAATSEELFRCPQVSIQ